MPVEVILPRVDMDMTAGRISKWLVPEGARVNKGDPIFEIETDKAAMEIDAPASGTLTDIRAAEGSDIPVGSRVAWIYADGESAAAPPAAAPVRDTAAPPPQGVAPPQHSAPAQSVAAATSDSALRATPLARRLAAERRMDLASIRGSGPRGRICAIDIETAAAILPPAAVAPLAAPPAAPPAAPAAEIALPAPAASASQGLHRQRHGTTSGAPVVFLHGYGSELATWRPVVTLLERAHPTLSIDLPGHGRSPAADQASIDAIADAVRAVLAAEGVERLHLVGHSLGGAVAIALAEDPALDVRSLCLLAPAGLGPDINGAFLAGFARATQPDSLAPWLRLLFANPALATPALVRAVLRDRHETVRTGLARLADALFPDGTQGFDLRTRLRSDIPAKIIWGLSDRIIPARHADGLPAEIALHRLPGVGHMPQTEAPELVARLIGELVRAGGG